MADMDRAKWLRPPAVLQCLLLCAVLVAECAGESQAREGVLPLALLSACPVDFDGLELSSPQPPLGEWAASMEDGRAFSHHDYGMLEAAIEAYIALRRRRLVGTHWVHGTHAPVNLTAFFGGDAGVDNDGLRFVPFVERWDVDDGARVAVWGDIHGSAKSLVRGLMRLRALGALSEDWTLLPGWHAAFLGDLVDRGRRSLEVLYTVLRLHNANPGRVAVIRGNHEDASLNAVYGLHEEFAAKLSRVDDRVRRLYAAYRYMPAACYVGPRGAGLRDYVQLSHGSWELGYSPRDLLAGTHGDAEHVAELRRQSVLYRMQFDAGGGAAIYRDLRGLMDADKHLAAELTANVRPRTAVVPASFGLLWHDLSSRGDGRGESVAHYLQGRGVAYGQRLFEWLVDAASSPTVRLRGVVRGHQHNNAAGPMLDRLRASKGVADLYALGAWSAGGEGSEPLCGETGACPRARWATTVLSAPEANFVFEYDSFAVIRVGVTWGDWALTHHWKPHGRAHVPFAEVVVHGDAA